MDNQKVMLLPRIILMIFIQYYQWIKQAVSVNINTITSSSSSILIIALTFIFLVKNVASVIPNQWKTFGKALNISHDELFVIQHYYGHDFHKFCRVIEEWRLSDTIPFTCEVLLAVLHSIEQDSLGRELRAQRYLINVYN